MLQDLLNIPILKEESELVTVVFKVTTYERIESETQDLSKHSKQKKKPYYRKILLQLIDDLDGRTYLDTPKRKV